jgi:ribose transport system permease protein
MTVKAQPKLSEGFLKKADRPVAIAFACIVGLLLVGSIYSRSFLSPDYLLQQLKVASFLGVIGTGTMIVILLGQIDLSVPWLVAVGGMMSDGGDRMGDLWGKRSPSPSASPAALGLDSLTVSASPICASRP